MTGNSHAEDIEHFMAQGTNVVLPKPLHVAGLKAAIAKAFAEAEES